MLGGLPVAVFMEFLPVILFLGSKSNGLAVGGCAPLDTPSVLLADRGCVATGTYRALLPNGIFSRTSGEVLLDQFTLVGAPKAADRSLRILV